jgi:hypothetical protein
VFLFNDSVFMLSHILGRGRLVVALVSSASLWATSCSKQADLRDEAGGRVFVSNDFESLAGWLGTTPQPSLTNEQAHSGHYALKVDGTTAYSLNYNSTLGQMSDVRLTKLRVSAWVLVPDDEAHALLVTHIGDAPPATKAMLWDGFDVAKASQKRGQWVHVSKVLNVPAEANASTNIGLYLWCNSGTKATYIDDIVVSEVP